MRCETGSQDTDWLCWNDLLPESMQRGKPPPSVSRGLWKTCKSERWKNKSKTRWPPSGKYHPQIFISYSGSENLFSEIGGWWREGMHWWSDGGFWAAYFLTRFITLLIVLWDARREPNQSNKQGRSENKEEEKNSCQDTGAILLRWRRWSYWTGCGGGLIELKERRCVRGWKNLKGLKRKELWKLKIRNGYINKNVLLHARDGANWRVRGGTVNDREGNKWVIFQRVMTGGKSFNLSTTWQGVNDLKMLWQAN